MKRTISGMTASGSLAHNRRDFIAENVNPNRVYLNICYRDENLKDVYKELFDESVERYNVGENQVIAAYLLFFCCSDNYCGRWYNNM